MYKNTCEDDENQEDKHIPIVTQKFKFVLFDNIDWYHMY